MLLRIRRAVASQLSNMSVMMTAVAMPSGLHPRVLVVGYFNRVGLLAVVL